MLKIRSHHQELWNLARQSVSGTMIFSGHTMLLCQSMKNLLYVLCRREEQTGW